MLFWGMVTLVPGSMVVKTRDMTWRFLLILGTILVSCMDEPDQPLIPLIIDADTANEVDDLYAIARALVADELYLFGITAAQFHTSPLASSRSASESQSINDRLVNLSGRLDVRTVTGAQGPIAGMDKPRRTAASRFIASTAQRFNPEVRLSIAILGSCTNVASAILQDTSIVSNIKVYYLGFWHDPETNSYDKKEFNSRNDSLAMEVLLNTPGLDLTIMSATTSANLVFEKAEADRQLRGSGALGDYLVQRWENFDPWWESADSTKASWVMWDLALIEAILHPEMARTSKFLTPPENMQREIQIYDQIKVQPMTEDFWQAMKSFQEKQSASQVQ